MKAWSLFSKKSFNVPPPVSLSPQRQLSATNTLRRELVNVALRSTLLKHGIPMSWIAIEIQSGTSSKGEMHSYVRLLVKHWEPDLLPYMVALQNSLLKRIFLLDTTAHSWLRSLGWQFSLPDESACPDMPVSGSWQAQIIKMAPLESLEPLAAPQEPPKPQPPKPKPKREPTPHESALDMLIRTMDDRGSKRYKQVDFQNTEPFEHAEAGSRR
jgi:hypothetical protein